MQIQLLILLQFNMFIIVCFYYEDLILNQVKKSSYTYEGGIALHEKPARKDGKIVKRSKNLCEDKSCLRWRVQ